MGTELILNYMLPLLTNFTDIFQVGECRRVQRLAASPAAGLLVVLCGRGPSVRLFALAELESSEVAGTKIPESRGCQALVTGRILQARTPVLCVAVKRQVLCYQLGPGPGPWQRRIRELQAPAHVQSLVLLGDRLCVGAAGTFALYPLLNEATPLALGAGLVPEELPPSRGGLGEALGAVELSLSEFLLLFATAGVYVDGAGRKSRGHELLWPVAPTGWGKAGEGPIWVGQGTWGASKEERVLPILLSLALETLATLVCLGKLAWVLPLLGLSILLFPCLCCPPSSPTRPALMRPALGAAQLELEGIPQMTIVIVVMVTTVFMLSTPTSPIIASLLLLSPTFLFSLVLALIIYFMTGLVHQEHAEWGGLVSLSTSSTRKHTVGAMAGEMNEWDKGQSGALTSNW